MSLCPYFIEEETMALRVSDSQQSHSNAVCTHEEASYLLHSKTLGARAVEGHGEKNTCTHERHSTNINSRIKAGHKRDWMGIQIFDS